MSISQSPYTLVVCEKPDAARRIAYALGNSNIKERSGLPPVFSATDHRNENFVVCSAIGHLYGLIDSNRNRSVYPVFDVKWAPIEKKTAIRCQQIIKSISLLSEKATRFVHACDYDQEGEVIGYNILQYACKNKYENSPHKSTPRLVRFNAKKIQTIATLVTIATSTNQSIVIWKEDDGSFNTPGILVAHLSRIDMINRGPYS